MEETLHSVIGVQYKPERESAIRCQEEVLASIIPSASMSLINSIDFEQAAEIEGFHSPEEYHKSIMKLIDIL